MVKALETPSKTSLNAPEVHRSLRRAAPRPEPRWGFRNLPVIPGFNLRPVASLVILGHAPFIPAGRGQSCAAREVASRSGFLASFALNRTVRRDAITSDNVGLSVALFLKSEPPKSARKKEPGCDYAGDIQPLRAYACPCPLVEDTANLANVRRKPLSLRYLKRHAGSRWIRSWPPLDTPLVLRVQ